MPVTCPICGGGHPKWDCKRQDLVRVPLPEYVSPKASDLVVPHLEAVPPEGVVIPRNGIPRWVNDWPGDNFQKKIEKGYRIVEKDGHAVTRNSGPGLQYLMVAPERLKGPEKKKGWNETIQQIQSNSIIEGTAQEVAEPQALSPSTDYTAYMRDYMKKYRARKKEKS